MNDPRAVDDAEMVDVPALSPEQRWALRHVDKRPRGALIGSGNDEIPRVTAKALERRGLVEIDGLLVRITDLGGAVVDALARQRAART